MELVLYRSEIGVRLLGTKKLEFFLRGLRALIKIPWGFVLCQNKVLEVIDKRLSVIQILYIPCLTIFTAKNIFFWFFQPNAKIVH